MSKGKIFFVVGHKHWGKSKTLARLTNDKRPAWSVVNGERFFIRRMSNDDRPGKFFEFLKSLKANKKTHVIIALCPTFEDKAKRAKISAALGKLKAEYLLFFFVLKHAFRNPRREIKAREFKKLERFGKARMFPLARAEKERRAKAFREFINKNM